MTWQPRSWMKKLCAIPDEAVTRLDWMTYVQPLTDEESLWGHKWSVATNGRGLLAVRDGGVQADRDTGRRQATKPVAWETIRRVLAAPIGDPRAFLLGDLRLWLGPRVAKKCPACKGAIIVYQGTQAWECEECIGGFVTPDRQSVRLWPRGPYFDPQLLSTYLPKALGGGWATFGLIGHWNLGDHTPPLLVEGQRDGLTWRAAVSPLGEPSDPLRSDRDTAPTYVPGIGELWHLRHGGRRGILRDWCEERGVNLDTLEAMPF